MKPTFYFTIKLFLLINLAVAWLDLTPVAAGVNPGIIVLKAEKQLFVPAEFFLAEIADARTDRGPTGVLFNSSSSAGTSVKLQPHELQYGFKNGLQNYLNKSVPKNTNFRPVTLVIKQIKLVETSSAKGVINGTVSIAFAFNWKRNGLTIPLTEYKTEIKYNRGIHHGAVPEQRLRLAINNGLLYFNNWINREVKTNEKLALGLNISFTDHTFQTEPDTVFYAPGRPLVWSDFQAFPRTERFAAAVAPGFAYTGFSQMKDGIIYVNLKLKVFVAKNGSWVREGAADAYGLNHEQRHFDLVKLIGERFKQYLLAPENLTIEDYYSQIQYQYIAFYREMNQLQEEYDTETSHGRNMAAQETWNRKIEEELLQFGVKK